MRRTARQQVEVGEVEACITSALAPPPRLSMLVLVANWTWVRWLTVFLLGVGLALAGWLAFGSPQAEAQTLSPLDPADCADSSGSHLPDGYDMLSSTEQTAVVADCEALVAIRNHFLFGPGGGETLNRGSIVADWGTGTQISIDDWDGVTYASNRVQGLRIVIQRNNLSGTIPPAIGMLSGLTNLHLYNNSLSGEIPSTLGNLTNLTNLRLDSNSLSGEIPSTLGNLGSLEIMWLYGNQLSGEIPSELGDLTNLQQLYLYSNQLSGEIPSELGNLNSLQQMHLYSNQLSGEIPSELAAPGNLNSLQRMWLSGNQLSGEIPSSLGNLPSLQLLYLQNNQLSGEIPSELGDLDTLQQLQLQSNQLSGAIPSELAAPGNLPNLQHLRLQNNQLSGEIPSTLGNLASLQFMYLHSNQLSGAIPSELAAPGNLPDLRQMWLHRNQLSGAIPGTIGNLGNLQQLWLHNNQLSGQIPATLNNLGNLQQLWLQNNQLSGTVPTLSGLTSLVSLYLCNNDLTIDSSSLRALRDLVASDNALCTGPEPVVRAIPGDGQVVLRWSYDGANVARFEYRSRIDSRFFWGYDLAGTGWTAVPGGASVNSVTVTMLTYREPPSMVGDPLENGQTYEFEVRAVLRDGGTSFWPQVEANVMPVQLPLINPGGEGDNNVSGGDSGGVGDDFARFSACAGIDGRSSQFEDIANSFAVADIECIYQLGITKGRTATMFAPGETVSRWQMALFLARAAGVAGVGLADPVLDQGFTDIDGLSEEAQQAANALAQADIMPGTSRTEFSPNSLVTRSSMAMLLDAFLDEAIIGTGGTDPADVSLGGEVFTDIDEEPVARFNAIRNIYELGVTRGVTATMFGPDGLVTREQMAAFLARMLGHTVARPAGITIQTQAETFSSVDGSVTLLVSVRDAEFQPVVDAIVDIFSYSDAGEAFGAGGECTSDVTRLGAGTTPCQIDLADDRTDTNGDFEIILNPDMVTDNLTVVAWTGDDGDTYDDATTISASLSLAGRKPASQFLVSDNLGEEQRKLRFGDTFELVFQLADMDKNPIALSGVPIRVSIELSAGGGTTTRTRNYRTDSAGRIRFPFTQNDPSNDPDPDTTLWFEVTTPNEYPINDGNTTNGCSGGVCEAFWSDDQPMPTTLRLSQTSRYTLAGDGASNRVTATITDQYGQPIRDEEVSLVIEGFPASQEDEDGDGIPGLVRSTNRRGQYSLSYTRNAASSLIDQIVVRHTGPTNRDGRGPLLPSGDGEPGRETLTHYWVTEPTNAELTAGIENKTILIADTANNRIIFQNGDDNSDAVRFVEYDRNDQFNQGGAISLSTFEERISADGATITVENYMTDAGMVSRFTIPTSS